MRRLLVLVFLLLVAQTAFAALTFPALTGRVVDDAHILSASIAVQIDHKLADYEQATTNQIVVVTLPSLQGTSIEDYGYQLGRNWGIGQKGKNNGVLLIVAPNERKVRIEVGYGLEASLTDAQSRNIIENSILPEFRAGRMEKGVKLGADNIIATLKGDAIETAAPTTPAHSKSAHAQEYSDIIILIFILICMAGVLSSHSVMTTGGRRYGPTYFGGGSSGGFSGGGGGFSGGGGSFGGGGASGSW
jgi:uncharacterized protein